MHFLHEFMQKHRRHPTRREIREQDIRDADRGSGVRFVQTASDGHRRSIELIANEEIKMSTAPPIAFGQIITFALEFDDQFGNVLTAVPKPDTLPSWTQGSTATGRLDLGADHLSAVYTPLANGTDSIGVSLLVGGISYAASCDVTVGAAGGGSVQVMSSLKLVAVVSGSATTDQPPPPPPAQAP
jgi:hypothetical protein